MHYSDPPMRGQVRSFSLWNGGVKKYTQTVKKKLQKNSIQDRKHGNTDGTIVLFVLLRLLWFIQSQPASFANEFHKCPKALLVLSEATKLSQVPFTATKLTKTLPFGFHTAGSRKHSGSCLLGLRMNWGQMRVNFLMKINNG